MTLQWKCARCGQGTWLHHEACVACGAAKPAPPPAEPPSDLARAEPLVPFRHLGEQMQDYLSELAKAR